MSTVTADRVASLENAPSLEALRHFIEHEADLLDEQRFEEWYDLYTDDAVYWVPAAPDQESWLRHVSLFYDDKHTMKVRIDRLKHPKIHCQTPKSRCVRVISNVRLDDMTDAGECLVRSKFVMIEDRPEAERRFFGGRCSHTLRREGDDFRIALKRVDLTNCDHSFPMLTQPF
jgi:benzoate/toluate 1,2-dioxygenase beta subunit